jgi:hypothetical protein
VLAALQRVLAADRPRRPQPGGPIRQGLRWLAGVGRLGAAG